MVSKVKGADATRWNRMSVWWRRQHPLCAQCLAEGRVSAAHAVDHKIPHDGDPRLLFDVTNLQSLCQRCHDSWKQGLERRGYDKTIGVDGWPIDPEHPA